ncbi:hypothetical protein ACFL60_01995 [Candidatus Omnitrophota bacterium]
MFRMFPHLDNEHHERFCMAMTDLSGHLKWIYGEPASGDVPYCSHQGEHMVCLADVNGDAQDEILAICGPGRLGMFDMNGNKLDERELPSDNFSLVKAGRTGPKPGDITVIVGVSEKAYLPHTYSNPVILLDAKLNIIKEINLPGGMGHNCTVFDADGDGWDEFLVGYTLIDHDGEILWIAEGFDNHETQIDAVKMHADCVEIINGDKPEHWVAIIAGSDTTYMFDHNGALLWKQPGIHPQYVMSGRFDSSTEDLRLFVLHQRKKMEMLDMDGKQIWEGVLPGNWPLGRPSPVVSDCCFHMSKPASLWKDPMGTGLDLIVYNEAGWPYAVDGFGQTRVEFPCPESSRQPARNIPRKHRPDDYGYGYHAVVADIDCDGFEEVIIHDRDRAWIYGLKS